MYSERTTRYVEAPVRDGSAFDYQTWLRDIKDAAARSAAPNRQETQSRSFEIPGKDALRPDAPVEHRLTSADQHPGPSRQLGPIRRFADRTSQRRGGKASIERCLKEITSAFDQWQRTRDRNAVYAYLKPIFALVKLYERRGRVRSLVVTAQGLAGFSLDRAADPFSVVLKTTCRGKLDNKTVSKFARALRYASRYHEDRPVAAFIKQKGGINRCAVLYARRLGRKRR